MSAETKAVISFIYIWKWTTQTLQGTAGSACLSCSNKRNITTKMKCCHNTTNLCSSAAVTIWNTWSCEEIVWFPRDVLHTELFKHCDDVFLNVFLFPAVLHTVFSPREQAYHPAFIQRTPPPISGRTPPLWHFCATAIKQTKT